MASNDVGQRPTVVKIQRRGGVVIQDCDLYVGRACFRGGWQLYQSKWHNPFKVGIDGSLEEILQKYENYVRATTLYDQLEELSGLRLGCWCHPNPCHADVLVRLLAEKQQ